LAFLPLTRAAGRDASDRRRRRTGRRCVAVGLVGDHDDAVGRVAHAIGRRHDEVRLAERDGADVDAGRQATGLQSVSNGPRTAFRETVIVVLGTGGIGAADDVDARRLDGVDLAHDEVERGGLGVDRLLAVGIFARVEHVITVPREVDDALLAQLAVGVQAVRVSRATRLNGLRLGDGYAGLARGGIGILALMKLFDPAIEFELLRSGSLRVALAVRVDPRLQRAAHRGDFLAIGIGQSPVRRILKRDDPAAGGGLRLAVIDVGRDVIGLGVLIGTKRLVTVREGGMVGILHRADPVGRHLIGSNLEARAAGDQKGRG
jgi:hypothetical protein